MALSRGFSKVFYLIYQEGIRVWQLGRQNYLNMVFVKCSVMVFIKNRIQNILKYNWTTGTKKWLNMKRIIMVLNKVKKASICNEVF